MAVCLALGKATQLLHFVGPVTYVPYEHILGTMKTTLTCDLDIHKISCNISLEIQTVESHSNLITVRLVK